MSQRRYWLVKSEPADYSIDDLRRDGSTAWSGVRNYEARNLMRDETSPGDVVLFYHSNANPSGVAGVARVLSEPYPDPTQFDEDSVYHDANSAPASPRWWLVDIGFVEKLNRVVSLAEIREHPELADMVLLKKLRLSVQPVTAGEFRFIRALASAG
jgi:predicted RNA-binding protein with PUA-like domain